MMPPLLPTRQFVSVDLEIGDLDDLAPAVDVFVDPRRCLLRRFGGDDANLWRCKDLRRLLRFQSLHRRLEQAVEDVRRRTGAGKQSLPLLRTDTGISSLGH